MSSSKMLKRRRSKKASPACPYSPSSQADEICASRKIMIDSCERQHAGSIVRCDIDRTERGRAPRSLGAQLHVSENPFKPMQTKG